jgi:hypothetical protein
MGEGGGGPSTFGKRKALTEARRLTVDPTLLTALEVMFNVLLLPAAARRAKKADPLSGPTLSGPCHCVGPGPRLRNFGVLASRAAFPTKRAH